MTKLLINHLKTTSLLILRRTDITFYLGEKPKYQKYLSENAIRIEMMSENAKALRIRLAKITADKETPYMSTKDRNDMLKLMKDIRDTVKVIHTGLTETASDMMQVEKEMDERCVALKLPRFYATNSKHIAALIAAIEPILDNYAEACTDLTSWVEISTGKVMREKDIKPMVIPRAKPGNKVGRPKQTTY